jgi:cytochrome P450
MASDAKLKTVVSPPGHWFWGHAKLIFNDPINYVKDVSIKYSPLCKIRVLNRPVYITADTDCARQIFLSGTNDFEKGQNYKRMSLVIGNGLIASEGEFWKRQRRLAQPGFHREKIRSFIQIFIDSANELSEKWSVYNSENIHRISSEMSELTLRIIGLTLFGIDLYKEASTVPPDVKELIRFLNKRNYAVPKYPMNWPLKAHKDFFERKERIDKVVFKIIEERIKGITKGDDLLQMFLDTTDLETGEKMSGEQIRDEVMTMFLAGYETSSVALTWVWYVLSQNENVHKKFTEELDHVIGDGEVCPDHIMKRTYTRQIIDETLRMYPPVFTIPRQVAKDTEMLGYRLKKGAVILTSIMGLHRNPAYWENPDTFVPERFAPENQDKIVKNAYIPFGTGQRICIGNQFAILEMVAVMAVMGRKFRLIPEKNYKPEMIAAITTNVSEGMPMHISKTEIFAKGQTV